MKDTQTLVAENASRWLAGTLWPLAMQAAGLAADTTLAEVQALGLAPVKTNNKGEYPDYALLEAQGFCEELLLCGAVLVAAQLALSDLALQQREALLALIWRDAIEYSIARTYDFEVGGMDSGTRYDLAAEKWQLWQATDEVMKGATETYLRDTAEAVLWAWSPEKLAARQQEARQLKAGGLSPEHISRYTGLSVAEIEAL